MGVLLLITYEIIGFIIGLYLFDFKSVVKRCWLGGTMGLMLLMWSHVPFSFFCGFSILSHILGLLLSLTICAFVVIFSIKQAKKPEKVLKNASICEPTSQNEGKLKITKFGVFQKSDIALFACVIPLLAISIFLLVSHVLVYRDGAYYTGQATYGDMNMHLGFITSIAKQQMFPPTYSILAGEPLNYPFLCDSISSSVYLFGNSLKTSYIAPMVVAFLLCYMGIWYLGETILKSWKRATIAYTLFVFDGGFGFLYFLDNLRTNKENFTRIFTAFYETPTNLVDEGNIRWTNIVADMLFPQRATLFGWTCLFATLFLLYEAVFENKKQFYLIAGIMAGLLPMIHTHSYFAVGLIAIAWIVVTAIRDKFSWDFIKNWSKFGFSALLLSVPQLLKWTFNANIDSGSFVRFVFNWSNSDAGDTWLWFWVKNLGIVFLLIPTAFLNSSKKKKCIYSGALLIFAVAEFIVFQPNKYDNIKLFFIWYLFMCFMVTDLLVSCYKKLKSIKGIQALAAMLFVAMTMSGMLTIAREVVSGTKDYQYELYNEANVSAAEWISENTEPTATFLCYNNHNNTISSLTGRNIYVGAGTFLYYHGVDYQDKEYLMKLMFTDPAVFEANKEEAGIDYVYIGDYERGNIRDLAKSYFDETYDTVYCENGITIYKIR